MAKKNSYTDLSLDELQDNIVTEKKRLQQLKMNHSVSFLDNPMQIRDSRRSIAQMQTELQKRINQA